MRKLAVSDVRTWRLQPRVALEEVTVPNARATMALMESEKAPVPSESEVFAGVVGIRRVGGEGVRRRAGRATRSRARAIRRCVGSSRALREKTGACYVAAKSYRLGVGGGTRAFTTYCRKYFDLEVESLKTFSGGAATLENCCSSGGNDERWVY